MHKYFTAKMKAPEIQWFLQSWITHDVWHFNSYVIYHVWAPVFKLDRVDWSMTSYSQYMSFIVVEPATFATRCMIFQFICIVSCGALYSIMMKFPKSANQIAQIGSCDRSRIHVPDPSGTGVWPGKNGFHKKCKNLDNIAVYLIASLKSQWKNKQIEYE